MAYIGTERHLHSQVSYLTFLFSFTLYTLLFSLNNFIYLLPYSFLRGIATAFINIFFGGGAKCRGRGWGRPLFSLITLYRKVSKHHSKWGSNNSINRRQNTTCLHMVPRLFLLEGWRVITCLQTFLLLPSSRLYFLLLPFIFLLLTLDWKDIYYLTPLPPVATS